jgi:serine protease Do
MSNEPRNGTSRRVRTALMASLLGATALAGYGAGHLSFAADNPAASSGATAAATPGAPITPAQPAEMLPNFTALVARVKPAVVSVTTELKASNDEGGKAIETPFGMLRPNHPRAIEAKGSGFLIDANGTIVTNNHVVANAKSVSVTLSDGSELPAKIIGRDPFGLGGTVTAGIVSARGRDIGSGPYDDFLQIDAPINQGNSGGPLFTQDGRVVGVNTAILSPSGGSIGIGFAIPSDMVRTVVADLEKDGHVTRGYLGVEAQQISPAMATALHLTSHMPNDAGALVAGVQSDSPAAKAGVQPGDVITAVDGKRIANPRDLALDVADIKPGSEAKVDLLRDGNQQTVTVAIATLKNEQVASRDNGNADQSNQGSVGLALAPLNGDMRSQLDVPNGTRGAVVAQVRPGSPAEQAGIRQGDVIVGVGAHAVHSPQDAVNAIHDALHGDKSVALRIMRDGQTAFVAVNSAPPGGANTNQGSTTSDDDSAG